VKNYNIKTIKPLINAAGFLSMRSLLDVCTCMVATHFYVEPSMLGIEEAKKKFGIKFDITEE